MLELLKSMIDWNSQPSFKAESGAPIIASGEPTLLIFCLETGTAIDGYGRAYSDGDIIGFCEALALESYNTPVTATSTCKLVAIGQETLESALKRGGKLVWPLSLSIASDITRRRLASWEAA